MSASKNDLDPKRLFQNLSAWFSGSVAARRRTLWVKHGGKIDDVKMRNSSLVKMLTIMIQRVCLIQRTI